METITKNNITMHTPEFWFQTWLESMTGETEAVTRGHSTAEFWDNMSRDYDHNYNEESRKRTDGFIDDIERRGFFAPDMRVLDVGCGTGRLAIALADRGADVTALDFSRGMLDKLEENRNGSPVGKITVVHDDWTAMDIGSRGWEKGFDLVIAHMTPAVRSPETLVKLMDATKENCIMKTWAEKRRSAILDDIWRMFTNTEPSKRPAPLVYMFNAIYAMNFYPSLDYEPIGWDREQKPGDALDQYVSYACGMFDNDEAEIRSRIEAYLQDIAIDGHIVEHVTGRTGRMMWKIS